jgi:hypothetical protein
LELARSLHSLVEAEAVACEGLRTTTAPAVDAMWSSGLMTAMNPAAEGGIERSFRDTIETWIEKASQDGSFG